MSQESTRLAVRYSGDSPPGTLRVWYDAHGDRVFELHVGGGYNTERADGLAMTSCFALVGGLSMTAATL